MNFKCIAAGITGLFLVSFSTLAQLQVTENRAAKNDSIVIQLPHETQLILVTDDVKKLRYLENVKVDSLLKALNKQLTVLPPVSKDTTQAKLKAYLNTTHPLGQNAAVTASKPGLFLWTGLGAGMIGKHFIPQFTPSLAWRQNQKEYSVGVDFLFRLRGLGDNENKEKYVTLQPFLNVGYGFKRTNKLGENNYHRVSIGYLLPTTRYDKWRPSFKLSYMLPIAKTAIKLVPEVYFFNAYTLTVYNKISPALSIRF